MLILGISAIFASGALANSYGTTGNREAYYTSIVGFVAGVFVLISMIGAM
jgi:uncharacterized protein YqgC (DUF456 family)